MSSSHNENMLETNNKELISKKIFICLETRNYFYKKKKKEYISIWSMGKEELNGNY